MSQYEQVYGPPESFIFVLDETPLEVEAGLIDVVAGEVQTMRATSSSTPAGRRQLAIINLRQIVVSMLCSHLCSPPH